MKRLEVIDGMRGYFLVFMLINHLVFTGGYWLVEINHRQLAFVEDAQGFVFLSGLLIGLVYTRKMQKYDFSTGASAIWNRAFELYRYAIGTILVMLALYFTLPGAQDYWRDWIGVISFDDPARWAAMATFLYQPTFMDILPQYIIYMIFAPFLVWWTLKGQWAAVLVGSFIVWMAGQLGLHWLATVPLHEALLREDGEGLRASFNLFGWQIVFFSAMVLGVMTASKKIDWSRVFSPDNHIIPLGALAICLFFLPLRILTAHEIMPDFVVEKFWRMEIRRDFGPVYLVNFAAVAAGFAWLLIAGPKHANATVRKIAGGIEWLFTRRFLMLLGRHSLQVYVWHVFIVYAVKYLDGFHPDMSQLTKTLIAVSGIALLALPAIWREREQLALVPRPAK